MKLDFREIYDSGREGEATPQLNQHSRNGKLPEAFQLRGRFAWINKRQRNFSGNFTSEILGLGLYLSSLLSLSDRLRILHDRCLSWGSCQLVQNDAILYHLRRFLFSTHLLFAACFRSWNTFPSPFSFTAFSATRTWASWLSFFF